MNNSEKVTSNCSAHSSLTRTNEETSNTQVMANKSSSMQCFLQVMNTVAHKSFTRACQFFCIPVCGTVACCSAEKSLPSEKRNTQEPLQSTPSTIMIVNISNSTMIDCIIGNSHPCAATERQCLLQEGLLFKPAQVSCSCGHGQQGEAQKAPPAGEHLNINIQSSHLNCVIVGDNNYMQAEMINPLL